MPTVPSDLAYPPDREQVFETKLRVVTEKPAPTIWHTTPPRVLRRKFDQLIRKWKAQYGPTSSQTVIESCPARQEIVDLGLDLVPLIMEKFEKGEKHHLFSVLEDLTGLSPVRPKDRGNGQKMRQAWLEWWRAKR